MMADKENMKETAARQIVEAVQFANFAGVNAADFGVSLSASLFRNIRDAMFHFNAMCDYFDTDEEQAARHYYSLMEHLSRGEKDAVITFGKSVADAVFDLLRMDAADELFGREDIADLQHCVHQIKNTFMDMRTGGMHLKEKKGIPVQEAWEHIAEQTEKIAGLCRQRSVDLF